MNLSQKILIVLFCLAAFQTVQADWTKQNANTLAWLHDIHFFDENRGVIVGSNGTFLETEDSGINWTKRQNLTEDNIRQIYFSDAENGWLLCERDQFNRGPKSLSYLMKTSDGGANWEKIELKNAGRTRLTKIFFNRKDKGYAVGEGGAFFELQTNGTWEKSPSPIRYLLTGGAFFDDRNGVVVGAGGNVYFTEDAGASWKYANLFGKSATKLNSVFFLDQRNGWAVGASGKIFQTFSGGKTWREQKSGVAADLSDVFFRNTAEGWAVGDGGTILHTKTAGNVWTAEQTRTKHKLEKIIFVGKKGFAVGFGGTILSYGANDSKNQSVLKPALLKQNK